MALYSIFICSLITFSFSLLETSAIYYHVNNVAFNTSGGIRFTNEIGRSYTKKVMGTISNFIWSDILQQNHPFDRKQVDIVTVYIVKFKSTNAITWGDKINVSAVYLNRYKGDVKRGFTSLLYHAMTNVFQWNAKDGAPIGLLEGIADYTVLKANYTPPGFAKKGDGERWYQGFDVTARFLEYCDGIAPGIVGKLNNMMKETWDVEYFLNLTGKPVDQLWMEYYAKYG